MRMGMIGCVSGGGRAGVDKSGDCTDSLTFGIN